MSYWQIWGRCLININQDIYSIPFILMIYCCTVWKLNLMCRLRRLERSWKVSLYVRDFWGWLFRKDLIKSSSNNRNKRYRLKNNKFQWKNSQKSYKSLKQKPLLNNPRAPNLKLSDNTNIILFLYKILLKTNTPPPPPSKKIPNIHINIQGWESHLNH